MSVASQDVYLNLTTPISVVGSGGGGSYPANANFSTLTVSDGLTVIEGANIRMANDPTNPATPAGIIFSRDANPVVFGSVLVYDNVQSTLGVLDYANGGYSVGALSLAALKGLSSINGVSYTGSTVPPNLTLSSLNVSSMITTSSIVTNEITAVASLLIQPTVDINILAGGNAQLASVSLDTTINSARATNIYSSQNINIQAAVSTNMTTQVNKINSLQSTIMNSPATYISSTNIVCDGGVAGGAFVATTPYSIAFPLGAGIFSSLSAQPGAVGYSWPMFSLEQYQKISTVCGF